MPINLFVSKNLNQAFKVFKDQFKPKILTREIINRKKKNYFKNTSCPSLTFLVDFMSI